MLLEVQTIRFVYDVYKVDLRKTIRRSYMYKRINVYYTFICRPNPSHFKTLGTFQALFSSPQNDMGVELGCSSTKYQSLYAIGGEIPHTLCPGQRGVGWGSMDAGTTREHVWSYHFLHHMQSVHPGQQLSEDDINKLSLKVAEFEGVVAKEVNVKGREQCVQRERAQVRLEASLVDAPALFWRMVVDDVTN